jgi:hypothetical protein
MTTLVLDMPGRGYLELPAHLYVPYVSALDLLYGAPVLLRCANLRIANPVALSALAQRLAGRHEGLRPGSGCCAEQLIDALPLASRLRTAAGEGCT